MWDVCTKILGSWSQMNPSLNLADTLLNWKFSLYFPALKWEKCLQVCIRMKLDNFIVVLLCKVSSPRPGCVCLLGMGACITQISIVFSNLSWEDAPVQASLCPKSIRLSRVHRYRGSPQKGKLILGAKIWLLQIFYSEFDIHFLIEFVILTLLYVKK